MTFTMHTILFISLLSTGHAGCPHLAKRSKQKQSLSSIFAGVELPPGHPPMSSSSSARHRKLDGNIYREGDGGIPEGGYEAVIADLETALVTSQDFFPADFDPPIGPHYGGLMIRLAWHCSGSFRESDGRGGCDGGRIRFDPEINWPDNANLNNAIKILEPIKEKYGESLSWGDLIILAGNTAISSMGGPIMGFCGGRIDDPDGSNSLKLGPSDEQEMLAPCVSIGRDGRCQSPLGPTTMGLIYVNPEGPADETGAPQPDPILSGEDVREAFSRMGFNDTESVALIGGGHAFGKAHGACVMPPCGQGTDMEGIGVNTFTSGLEGKWTVTPTTWSNLYFQVLFDLDWNLTSSPYGLHQWEPVTRDGSEPPDIFMLTTDLAMARDEAYAPISQLYAGDLEALSEDFAHAWYRLTTADMGPWERCIGDNVPEPQWWQYPLPTAPDTKPDYIGPRSMIQEMIDSDADNIAAFSSLAYNCASTFRETDYKGGCNGARIRFAPQIEWESNAGATEALATLESVKQAYPDVSYADLIVLAGQTAVEAAGGNAMAFCGGRVDATDGVGSEILEPRVYEPAVVSVRDDMQVKGLTEEEGVALFARPVSNALSNQYFIDLLGGNGDFSAEELALVEDADFAAIVEAYASDEDLFKTNFASAWTYMMTADRFAGPTENACGGVDDATLESTVAVTTEEPGTTDTPEEPDTTDASEEPDMTEDTGMPDASEEPEGSTSASGQVSVGFGMIMLGAGVLLFA